MSTRLHRTCGDGRWFPADGATLRRDVDAALAAATPGPAPGHPIGTTAPHAHIRYSGPIAAAGLAALRAAQPAPGLVMLLGFCHRGGDDGLALLDADAIASPLGETPLDAQAADALCATGAAHRDTSPHEDEHSAENLVPLVQRTFPEAPLAIGLFGTTRPAAPDALAPALAALVRTRNALIVASTDMLHDPDYALVRETDADTIALLEAADVEGLQTRWRPDAQCLCGIAPTRALLRAATACGARRGRCEAYTSSGDIDPSGRGHWVVGYSSVTYFTAPSEPENPTPDRPS